MRFRDREEAAQKLAGALHMYRADPDTIVLGIPRGGAMLAQRIAQGLALPLDIIVTKKIGAPGDPEFAIGSIDSYGHALLDENVLHQLGISPEGMEEEIERLRQLIKQKSRELRGDHPHMSVEGKKVIVVDDGVATGKTMQAAIRSLRSLGAAQIILAVPVAAEPAAHELNELVDETQILYTPALLQSVSQFYENFDQVPDSEVKKLLDTAPSM